MHDASMLNSSWQSILLAIPFVLTMLAGIFRLDEVLVTRKQVPQKQRLASGVDRDGRHILCDPDGRPFK